MMVNLTFSWLSIDYQAALNEELEGDAGPNI
jgi:hypothetical protein